MNRRRTLLLVIFGLGLAGGLAFLFWSKQSVQPVRLKIVRRAFEQGKQVVFFRVEVADGRQIQIRWAEKVVGDKIELPFTPQPSGTVKPAIDFWSSTQAWPIVPGQEFGVVVPTSVATWKLRLIVHLDRPLPERFIGMPKTWISLVRKGTPCKKAARLAWTSSLYRAEKLETDPITNAVAPEAFSKAMQ